MSYFYKLFNLKPHFSFRPLLEALVEKLDAWVVWEKLGANHYDALMSLTREELFLVLLQVLMVQKTTNLGKPGIFS